MSGLFPLIKSKKSNSPSSFFQLLPIFLKFIYKTKFRKLSKAESTAQVSKEKYTSKQKRQAKHIEESESGKGSKSATRIAWATVNKSTGVAAKATRKSASKKSSARSHSHA